eukprot:3125518-Amphidinium_carterae.1
MKGKRILRLDKENFKTVKNQHEDTYYEGKIMQELLQRSCITLHPTSGYKTATTEITRVCDGFEVENYLDTVKKKRTKDTEKEEDKTMQDLKKLKSNYIKKLYGLQKYWSSTHYYHNGLWTPGHYLAQYQRATWRILRTTDMAITTSTRKCNTPVPDKRRERRTRCNVEDYYRGKYMEMKAAYKQRHRRLIEDKKEYKQHHFHDYLVITTSIYLDEEYIKSD